MSNIIVEVTESELVVDTQVVEVVVEQSGETGPKGDPGVGIIAGGTAGQVLAKIDATDYNTEWIDQASLVNLTLTGDVTGTGIGTIATTLANTAVTAGSYTAANITVDSKGRITLASNGDIGVKTFNTRSGDVTLTSLDVTGALGYTPAHSGANSDITALSGLTGLISTPTGISFNTTAPATQATGRLSWDAHYGTLNVGLAGGNVNLAVGQEQVMRIHNNTGLTLTDGQMVYVNGSSGNWPTVALAKADAELTSNRTIGMVTEHIANGAEGFITTQGQVNNLDTQGLTEGASIYLSPLVAGGYTTIQPVAPQHQVTVGYIIRAHQNVGQVFVKVDNGYELDELHDVLTTNPTNGQVLTYNSTTKIWYNATPSTASGTVTSVGGTGTVSGLTLSGTVTTSGNLTLGGTLTLTSGDITGALGYTPYSNTNPSGYITGINGTDVTTALGYTPYSNTNPSGYITGIDGNDVTTALGYTPYSDSNPHGFISGITSTDVTTALGFTPYSDTNPAGYTTNTGTVTSVTVNGTAGRISSSGSPITGSGTISMDLATTAVSAGSYTYAALTVDSYGRLTAASSGATPAPATHASQHYPNGADPVNAQPYHGVVSRTTVAPLPTTITTTTFTLTCSTTPMTIYNNGVKYDITTDVSTTIGAAANLYFIYFDSTGTLVNSTAFPGLLPTSQQVLVATVQWNGTNLGVINDERHGYLRNGNWHVWAHNTIGARYGAGLTFTFAGTTGANTTFSVSAGNIYDEDINFTIPTSTVARLWRQTSASTYEIVNVSSTLPYLYSAGTQAVRSDTYALTTITSSNRYFNFFVYATSDVEVPVQIVTETVTPGNAAGYTSTTNARAASIPNLSIIPLNPEWKLLYRIIVNGAGLVQPVTTADDYRSSSTVPSGGVASTTASSVTYTPTSPDTSTTVQTALDVRPINALAPTGGTVSQVLTKNSSTNYDMSWADIPATKLSSLAAATANNSIDNTTYAQEWKFTPNATEYYGLKLTDVSVTSGNGGALLWLSGKEGITTPNSVLYVDNAAGTVLFDISSQGNTKIYANETVGAQVQIGSGTSGSFNNSIVINSDGILLDTSSTTMKLDASDGKLYINNVAGAPNEVIIANGSGIPTWGSLWPTPAVQTVTYSATPTIDWTAKDVSELTLTGNAVITNSGAVSGQKMILQIKQGGTGGYTISFTSETKFGTDITTITLSTAVGAIDMIGLTYSSLNSKYNVVAFVKGF